MPVQNNLKVAGLLLLVALASLPTAMFGQTQGAIEDNLLGLTSPDIEVANRPFYALLRPYYQVGPSTDEAVRNLLQAWPQESDKIKTALITALEVANAYKEREEANVCAQ
jgi:hypothetical protein